MGATVQRPLRGSRISTFYPVKTLPPISSLDSAFQLQEYISLLIRSDPHDVEHIVSLPGKLASKEKEGTPAEEEAKSEEKEGKSEITVDEACWIYEQLRRLAQDLTHPLITMLQQECTRSSCPEMKAGEWMYLCVAHGNDGAMEQCCAIDYILHTLDSATALLNSPRAFPSRLSIPQTSTRHFSALARRLGRIFAHAYFHHREAFEQAEAESSLNARFLALTRKFDLVPAEFLVIPDDGDVEPPRLLGAALRPQPAEERDGRAPSPSGPAGSRNESPRKMGRSRTDTMVFSEAVNVADELARNGNGSDGEGSERLRAPGTILGSNSPFALQPLQGPESSAADPIVIPEGETEVPSGEAEPAPAPEFAEEQQAPAAESFVMLAPPAETCSPYPPIEEQEQAEGNDAIEEEGKEQAEEQAEEASVAEADIVDAVAEHAPTSEEPAEAPPAEEATVEGVPVPEEIEEASPSSNSEESSTDAPLEEAHEEHVATPDTTDEQPEPDSEPSPNSQ